MKDTEQRNNVSFLQGALRRQQFISTGLAAFCALLFLLYIGAKGDSRTVLVPTALSQEVTVKGRSLDKAYLEELGLDVAPLVLTVNPRSIGTTRDRLLRITHPATHGEVGQRIDLEAERLRRNNASQVFWPNQVLADPDRQRVAVMGVLSTYINDRKTSDDTRAYVAEFEWSGSRLWLRDFKQAPLNDPFRLKPENAEKPNAEAPKKDPAP